MKRYSQGWVKEICHDLDDLLKRVIDYKKNKTATSIGFHGNIVSVWEYFLEYTKKTGELLIDLASDQTSCHNPFLGGYYPVQVIRYFQISIFIFYYKNKNHSCS